MSAAGARHAYEANRARIAGLWAEARPLSPGDTAACFLARSGVARGTWPAALRLHPALGYWQQRGGKPACLGSFPALLALFELDTYPHGVRCAPEAHAVALQRIYLAADGAPAAVPAPVKLTGTAGPALGACARLAPVDGTRGALGIAVGIVQALRIAQAARMPVWAVPDAHALAHARWPRGLRRLHVFADARDPAQWQGAAELARKAGACGLQAYPMAADMAHAPHLTATRL